jgi:hypothetical protein
MPYFQRATVETTFKPGERARVARGSDQVQGPRAGKTPAAPAPTPPGTSVVERAAAILAREPKFGDGLWPATSLPDQMLSALLPGCHSPTPATSPCWKRPHPLPPEPPRACR